MRELGDKVYSLKSNQNEPDSAQKELQDITERIKLLINKYDQISAQLTAVEQKYEEKSKSVFDIDKIKLIKDAINNIKKELNGIGVEEGLYRGRLMQEQLREGGDAFDMYNLIFKQKQSHQDEYADDSFEI